MSLFSTARKYFFFRSSDTCRKKWSVICDVDAGFSRSLKTFRSENQYPIYFLYSQRKSYRNGAFQFLYIPISRQSVATRPGSMYNFMEVISYHPYGLLQFLSVTFLLWKKRSFAELFLVLQRWQNHF